MNHTLLWSVEYSILLILTRSNLRPRSHLADIVCNLASWTIRNDMTKSFCWSPLGITIGKLTWGGVSSDNGKVTTPVLPTNYRYPHRLSLIAQVGLLIQFLGLNSETGHMWLMTLWHSQCSNYRDHDKSNLFSYFSQINMLIRVFLLAR